IQDYAISPFVIGKATHLHPVVILFSVVAGEHLYGILGVILAVPVAASIKIIYSFVFDKIYQKK
ncbi:MAG: AI-2E family transporter, partial [Candidatus Levyibacteriota bacterium]